jgi:NADPH:quinone reductase-like Zn-dependent oxidoreductase
VAHEITVSPIPDSLPYENAVVLPLAISTAAAGLYQKGFLEQPYPTLDANPTGKTILVWGGSSSVGSTVIQLAVASGLEVISTASKRNLEYVKSLGAKHALDYSEPTVVEDILSLLKRTEFVGAYDAISIPDSLKPTAEIVSRLGGGKIATVLAAPPTGLPSNVTIVRGKKTLFSLPLYAAADRFAVNAVAIAVEQTEVGDAVWRQYVPAALASAKLLAKPDPHVIKGGLPHVQEALDTLHQGVSAAKVVVEL